MELQREEELDDLKKDCRKLREWTEILRFIKRFELYLKDKDNSKNK